MKQPIQKKAAEYFFYFILYSFIGWVYEVFLEVVVYRWGFSNRGVLFGPYCIIYGVGALILIFTLGGLKKKRICTGRLCITPLFVFMGIWSYVKKKYKLNMPFLRLAYPARASAFSSNAA